MQIRDTLVVSDGRDTVLILVDDIGGLRRALWFENDGDIRLPRKEIELEPLAANNFELHRLDLDTVTDLVWFGAFDENAWFRVFSGVDPDAYLFSWAEVLCEFPAFQDVDGDGQSELLVSEPYLYSNTDCNSYTGGTPEITYCRSAYPTTWLTVLSGFEDQPGLFRTFYRSRASSYRQAADRLARILETGGRDRAGPCGDTAVAGFLAMAARADSLVGALLSSAMLGAARRTTSWYSDSSSGPVR